MGDYGLEGQSSCFSESVLNWTLEWESVAGKETVSELSSSGGCCFVDFGFLASLLAYELGRTLPRLSSFFCFFGVGTAKTNWSKYKNY